MLPDEVETFGRELGELLLPTREIRLIDDGPVALVFLALVNRTVGTSRKSFSAQWREAADRLVAIPKVTRHITRYVQKHTMPGNDHADGVVELGFPSAASAEACFTELAVAEVLVPGEASFVDHSRLTGVIARENVILRRAD